MRPDSDVREVFRLRRDLGWGAPRIAAATSVSVAQVGSWLRAGEEQTLGSPRRAASIAHHAGPCPLVTDLDEPAYAYLLGQYLGDGCISRTGRAWRLRISCCNDYPQVMQEVEITIQAVVPNRVGRVGRQGCTEVNSYSTHWPCLLPQHGPGPKHRRTIALAGWQSAIVLERHPGALVRGLIHSDGCRVLNRVRGANGRSYAYTRYFFKNESADIRAIFTAACDRLRIEWRASKPNEISIARRTSVTRLDAIVGPKA